jgi:hypothetical protein
MQIKEEYKTKIVELRDSFNEIVIALGQLAIQKATIERDENYLQEQYQRFGLEEEELLAKIQTEYGEGNLDIDTGEFTPKN